MIETATMQMALNFATLTPGHIGELNAHAGCLRNDVAVERNVLAIAATYGCGDGRVLLGRGVAGARQRVVVMLEG